MKLNSTNKFRGSMKIKILFFVILSSILIKAQNFPQVDIPYQKFVLDNGLTLIVHEDHKAPIVAVNVWYHVGSKNEKRGKTGFAHLFEHLMFNGSENFDDDYFQALERVGATDLNGTTNKDRTNYFQNVPKSAFDVALWMESDRMGHLLGAVTQAKLDEQRGVVQNEKRQGENQPYGRKIYWAISENTYPVNHPYNWQTIGYMEDLDSAKLNDVHEWFKTYYGAANAVLVIAGDVNPTEVKEKVEKYFGDIPAGPPITKQDVWVAPRTGTHRMQMQDRVPQSRIYMVWNVPEWKNKEFNQLELLSDVLASGKTSRLYKRLVYTDQIATDVNAYASSGEIGSQFYIIATAKAGVELSKVENAINDELNKIFNEGISQQEMQRVKTQTYANFVRGIERIGGFGGKSDILAQCEVYGGNPEYYKTIYKNYESATANDLKSVANKWLSDGKFVLEVHPYQEFKVAASGADRSKLPATDEAPDAKFPQVEKAELSNGMKIVLAKRSSIPVINMQLLVDAGFSADQNSIPGTASLTSNMMDEGTKSKNALQISEQLDMLGAQLSTSSGLDASSVYLSSLKTNLDKSLDLFADVILNPSFPENELERLKSERLAQIKREKSTPTSVGYRVLPQILYGQNHAYGNPLTGTGFENSIQKITKADLEKFHQTWFKPNNSTLIIVGDISMNEIKPKLEKLFSNWKRGEVPQKNISEVSSQAGKTIYLVNRPGAEQSVIYAAQVVSAINEKDYISTESMNQILGGSFTSRINMNLREDKHWSYGARSGIMNTKSQRPFIVSALVQTDKTMESMQEIYKEVTQYLDGKPVTEDELNKIKLNQTLELPGSWETSNAILNSLATVVLYNLPENYYETYSQNVKELTLNKIADAAKQNLKPDNLIWVVVGDKDKIESKLKELNYEIKYVDSDGNSIQENL